jgi:hypothetical protein
LKEGALPKFGGCTGWLSYVKPSLELPKIVEGGGPTGVKEPPEDGGGPAGVVEGFEAPKGLNEVFLRLSGVEGGLEEYESGT